MEPSENNSRVDGTNNLTSSYFPKNEDIEPVASGSLLKVNGDNHIIGLPFKPHVEDSCSSSNSSSSHNLVIDQPEEVTYNNNAGNESESETLKKAWQKDLSVNPLKRKFNAQENGSPEHNKHVNISSSNTLFTKSPQKVINNSPSEFFKEGKADINENRSSLTLSEAYEKKFKALTGSKGDGEDHFQEYAKYLRLKPAVKYKCFKCYNITFDTLAQLRNHQKVCFFKENHRHSSQDGNSVDAFSSNSNPSSIDNLSALAASEQMQAKLQKQFLDTKTTPKAKKKVFLCAACGTYYENWNLFLHMREVHKRHICLYCVGMFPTAEKLTLHLEMKHDLEQNHFENHEKLLRASRDTCYLMCCNCEHIFTEHDDFQDHTCAPLIPPCRHCGQCGRHNSNCITLKPERVKDKVKRKNKINKESSTREKRLETSTQPSAERTRLVGDSSCDTPKTRTENPSHWNFKANGCVPEANVRHSEQQVKPSEVKTVHKPSPARKDVANLPKLNNSHADVQVRHLEDEQGNNLNRTSSQVEDIAQSPRPTILKSILSDENKGRRSPQINSLFPAMRENKSFKGLDNDESKCVNSPKELSNENNNNSPIQETESNAIHEDMVLSMNTNSVEPLKNEEPPEKPLFVPKFKIKIPKEYQTPIDSEHSSTESDEEEMENSVNGGEVSEEETKEELQNNNDENVSDNTPEKMEQDLESVQEEQKSLESNTSKEDDQKQNSPENIGNAGDSDNNMDIEAPIEVHEAPKESPPDGIEVAGDDILVIELLLDRPLDKIPMVEFLRICMRSTYTICLYCNHARRIAVNGNSLALHMIAQHRFSATVDSITAEELQPPTIVSKLKAFLPDLEDIFFNMETYCSTDKEVFPSYEKIFECFLCRFETRVHKELYLHNRKMHLKTAILCFMCRANFFSYSEILCHMCPGMPNKCVLFDIKFRCCLCEIGQIPSAFRLMVHIRKKHFACDVCLEDCQDQSKLSSHVWKHKLHHLCYRCGIAYRNKPDITKHLFWKHGTESILCKRCLQKRWPHVYHFCIPPIIFNCDGCSLTFSKATYLKVHKRLHTGYAPYPCTEDNCEEKFISRKLLLKHVASHNDSPDVKPIEDVKEEEGKKDEDVKQENDVEDEAKKDSESGKKKKKKVKKESKNSIDDLMNLPAPNLSESDSSDDSETIRAKQDGLGPYVPKVMLSPPSDVGEDDREINTGAIMDIWENFKSFQASRNKTKKEEAESDELPMIPILHVSQSDHDYCMMYKPITKEDKMESTDIREITEKPNGVKETSSPKKKQKSPKKAKSGSDSSSSGSSSSSDSSCSCGSNCSCSSSSGSSSDSSSSSDGSNSSTSEGRRRIAAKRAVKEEKRNRNKSENSKGNTSEMVDVVGTDIKQTDTNSAIMEIDLETDESDTDEDFYDEHPQKLASQMLAEKRKQLMMQTCLSPSHNFDIVENSRPSTPSLPEEMMKEKKVKIKKKKRDKKASKAGVIPTLKLTIPSFSGPVNTPVVNAIKIQEPPPPPVNVAPQVEQLAPIISELLPLPSVVPQTPPVALQMPQPPQALQISQSRTSTSIPAPVAPRNRLSTGSSSDADAPLKRSKRARRPNRFYGYSSDDDSTTPHVTGPAAFKPTPPPNLTWRKEDLPAPSKSISAKSSKASSNSLKKNTPTNTPPLPPIPPIIIRPTGITSRSSAVDQFAQKPPVVEPMRVPPVPVHHIQPPQYYSSSRESMESESSDEDKLHIPVNTKYGAQRHANPIPPPSVQAAPSPQPRPPAKQRIPPALLPNPDLARLQYFQRNNIRWPIRPPAGARPPREGESVYCYCRCPYDEVSEMIACDGDDCMIEWFHFECVGIMVPPKGKWFCPECKPKYPHEMENYEDT